jgi:hypothetical protein
VVVPAVVPVLPVAPVGVDAAVVWSAALVLLVCDVVGGIPAVVLVAPAEVPGALAVVLEDGGVEL